MSLKKKRKKQTRQKKAPTIARPEAIPQNLLAEQSILCLCLLHPKHWITVRSALQVGDFYDTSHRLIFSALVDIEEAGDPIELLSLTDRLGPEYYDLLSELLDHTPPGRPDYWIRLVLEKSQLRSIWALLGRIREGLNEHANLQQVLTEIDSGLGYVRRRSRWGVEAEAAWEERLTWDYERNGRRELIPTKSNFKDVLSSDPRLKKCLVYDEFREDIVALAPPPWNEPPHSRTLGRTEIGGPWLDEDFTRLQCWLEAEYGSCLSRDNLAAVCVLVSRLASHHPIRDALEAVSWDGTPRIDTWLVDFLGASGDSDYLRFVGSRWLISAVARVWDPGCKADHVLILEGRQGAGKSTALELLATVDGRSWFSDTPINLSSKDAYLALQGKWIVELAELDSLMRAEDSQAKAFFSSRVDRYRPPYSRNTRDFPRRCVFAGSVNHSDYLRDETGGRRYWPVACGEIDLAGLRVERSQIWAEAVARYKSGERWFPTTREERELCSRQQAERQIEDPWLPILVAHLNSVEAPNGLTSHEILGTAIALPSEKIGRREQIRLGRIMAQLSTWRATRIERSVRRVRGYVPVDPVDNVDNMDNGGLEF